ncbi:MAG: SUMF1/EgtB/PvdO family nonheme iron enzyme [Opitutae bacterium]|jgi:serine/threonine protein kinase/formylglycine-generating enzyme required for sulfatase activity|nr:SUMF1/EgtB/PvdO family nonheme iron enzyme [Opitutae bacterium]MBT6462704.1 SUMF1/EgtB/PvdO family nonheme iron enzyme [Opitutae bacterium]MBT7852112.1 SUMF1/EgtB/PvdO family nonheme iron enzyme [Opitutae bacterium]
MDEPNENELPLDNHPGAIFQTSTGSYSLGQYEIVKLLGIGGMGQVYEVRHRTLKTRHALKLINPELLQFDDALEFFKKEALVMATLRHPGIVYVDEYGETDGHIWIRQELVNGMQSEKGQILVTLEDYIKDQQGIFPQDEVLDFMHQVLDALAFAHQKGCVHRDLKPGNILISEEGIKIVDFGLVQLMRKNDWQMSAFKSILEHKPDPSSRTERERSIAGTYEYMSPEQKNGYSDERSDLYALGLICLIMLTGRRDPGFKKPTELIKGIYPEWDFWIQKSLEPNPDDRFQSAVKMKEALPLPEQLGKSEEIEMKSTSDDFVKKDQAQTIENEQKVLGVGDTLGQYKILSVLGQGGMGRVFEVKHEVLETRHALKLIHPQVLEHEEGLQYFRNEAKVMAQLRHPGIVAVDDFDQTDGQYWLRSELISGIELEGKSIVSLEEYIDQLDGLPHEKEISDFLKQTLEAIGYAHSKGVIHCDLKPANILLHPEGTKIADFGIVRLIREDWLLSEAEPILHETQQHETSNLDPTESAIVGTYEFMSPEQRKGLRVDGRSDLYSIGLIAFRMLTGREMPGLKRASEIRRGIHGSWDRWLEKSLEENPAERFRTARDMFTALPKVRTPTWFTNTDKANAIFIIPNKIDTEANNVGRAKKVKFPLGILGALVVVALIASLAWMIKNLPDDNVGTDTDPGSATVTATQVGHITDKPPGPVSQNLTIIPRPPTVPSKQTITFKAPPDNITLSQKTLILSATSSAGLPVAFSVDKPEVVTVQGNKLTLVAAGTVTVTATQVGDNKYDSAFPVSHTLKISDETFKPQIITFESLPIQGKPYTLQPSGIELLWIKSGEFDMGSPKNEPGRPRDDDEAQHKVKITGFWMGKTEVTIKEWNKTVPETPQLGKERNPVTRVSWKEAMDFCRVLNLKQNPQLPTHEIRLPTEAEWEYACRAGTKTAYSFGDDTRNLESHAWYGKNANQVTHPVGVLPSNRFGLHDMHGNVREWCNDRYLNKYAEGSQTNPIGPKTGDLRVTRGGSWQLFESYCRSAARKGERPSARPEDLGLRIVLSPKMRK